MGLESFTWQIMVGGKVMIPNQLWGGLRENGERQFFSRDPAPLLSAMVKIFFILN